MARPIKNYCDYFPHDRDMRNHRKVKAIRTKFGIEGYAIWSMILEYLTGIDGNVFEYSDVEFELMGGDFGVSVETIRDVVDYCIKLELLFLKDGFINSDSLDENLKPVYEKRGKSKDKSKKQLRINGKFAANNTVSIGVSVTEMPQSKVDNIIVNNSKLDNKAPNKEDFMQYVKERCATVGEDYKLHEKGASIKYDAWVTAGWKDGYGNKINNWKSKIVSNLQYFKSASVVGSRNGTALSGSYEPENGTNYDKIEKL